MRKFIIGILLLFTCSLYGQNLDEIKHIELISEVSDTMALINKEDINKINKVFYERQYTDSLLVVNDSIINHLTKMKSQMDSIVYGQLKVIQNDKIIIRQLTTDNSELKRKLTKAHKTIF